jgi:porphobilinogen synthase
MPGTAQHTLESLRKEAAELAGLGIPALLLFGIPAAKDAEGSQAWAPTGSSSGPCGPCRPTSATTSP